MTGVGPTPLDVEQATFCVVANGRADGPAQALRDFLISRGAKRVMVILHPLVPEDGGEHEIAVFELGMLRSRRTIRLPSRPPLTYPLDLLVTPWARADVWFGFNSLSVVPGLTARAVDRVSRVVYWCVDFVDDRFGPGRLSQVYNRLDGISCRRADVRFELSEAALDARNARHAASGTKLAPAHVVPMGAWLDRVPVTGERNRERRTIVFLGHLVPRQGVDTLLRSVAVLGEQGANVRCEIIGRGPEEDSLRSLTASLGLGKRVVFHGFVPDHVDVEKILASGSVAVAPYADTIDSFTRYADPGKLKAYLAAGLPIVTTRVAPNAGDLEARGAASVVDDNPASVADAIRRLLASEGDWQAGREAALAAARDYDWNVILPRALSAVGIDARRS